MTTHRRAAALALILAGVATAAAAQPADGHGRRDGAERGGQAERIAHVDAMFRMLDADRDGRITAAEVDARRKARFAAADADGDGKLSLAEFDAMRRAMETERMFARLDADADGFVSDAEVAAREPRMLNRLDADDDGVVTRDEALTARRGHGMMRRD
jgi:Ca2+-binding EF-hand superfamily protein